MLAYEALVHFLMDIPLSAIGCLLMKVIILVFSLIEDQFWVIELPSHHKVIIIYNAVSSHSIVLINFAHLVYLVDLFYLFPPHVVSAVVLEIYMLVLIKYLRFFYVAKLLLDDLLQHLGLLSPQVVHKWLFLDIWQQREAEDVFDFGF